MFPGPATRTQRPAGMSIGISERPTPPKAAVAAPIAVAGASAATNAAAARSWPIVSRPRSSPVMILPPAAAVPATLAAIGGFVFPVGGPLLTPGGFEPDVGP